jgi:hypothetical protein
MTITTLDPTYEAITRRKVTRNEGDVAQGLASLSGVRIGLLANGKTNSQELLRAVYDELGRQPGVSLAGSLPVCKSSVSIPPSPEDFRRLVAETDAVLVAVGD